MSRASEPRVRADRTGGGAWALLRALRPRHWTKNLLVAAAPAAGGVITRPDVLWDVGAAFVAFCLAASATYLLNDVVDAPADRLHPVKAQRPIAAGQLSPRVAVVWGVAGLAAAVAFAALAGSGALAVVVLAYAVMMVAYSLWLRQLVIVDVAVIAGGFILRAVAGGVATGTPLSEWFLIVASFGALCLAAGKRHAEVVALGESGAAHRSALPAYTPAFTQYLLTLGSGVAAVGYCLWAFETPHPTPLVGAPWLALSVVPFVLGLLRYALLALAGRGGQPEEIALRDRPLQLLGAVWLLLVAVGTYG